MKKSTLTRLKPLFIMSLFTTFAGFSLSANASLSSKPATPNQIRIVAKAATPDQKKLKLQLINQV